MACLKCGFVGATDGDYCMACTNEMVMARVGHVVNCDCCGRETAVNAVDVNNPMLCCDCRVKQNKLNAAKNNDPINHPKHYTIGAIKPIAVIEDWKLGFCLGNTVKYIARAEHKGATIEDLKKARWYLDREIAAREKGGENGPKQ